MTAIPAISLWWRRVLFLVLAVVISLVVTAGLLRFDTSALPSPRMPKIVFSEENQALRNECRGENEKSRLDDLPDVLRALWAPSTLPIDAPVFKTLDGTEKKLPPHDQLVVKESFGKRLCILDVDTRPHNGDGGIFGKRLPSWDTLSHQSAGFLSHYTYAMIHNYTYKFVRSPTYSDRAPHWTKVIFTQELLKRFDVVIMLDYDAMFPSPEVPIEWMMNYWKVDRDVMVAMAEDPDAPHNLDLRKKLNVNTGFIIAQAGDNTQQLFKEWAECPTDVKYANCSEWKTKIFHEQAAFSSHVRYNFSDGLTVGTPEGDKYIRVLPCNEANGQPAVAASSGCTGQLVRHFWGNKDLTHPEFGHHIMNMITPQLTKAAFGNGTDVIEDYTDKVLHDDEILDKDTAPPPP